MEQQADIQPARSPISRHRMLSSAIGPILGLGIAMVLPFLAQRLLPATEFAFWVLLNTVSTIGLTVDLGGPVFAASQLPVHTSNHRAIVARAMVMTGVGSLAIGVIGTVVWSIAANGFDINGWNALAGALAILATTFAVALRSFTSVLSSVALAYDRKTMRNAILILQPALQLAFVSGAAVVTQSAACLPIGIFASSILTLTFGISMLLFHTPFARVPIDRSTLSPITALSHRYMTGRLGVVTLSLLLTQADRWALASVASASQLGYYELAWRCATIPKMVLLAATQVLIPDSAIIGAQHNSNLQSHEKRVRRYAIEILIASSPLAIAAAAFVAMTTQVDTITFVLFFAILLLGHTVHAITAIGSSLCSAIGKPSAEIGYLMVSVITAAFFATISIYRHNTLLLVAGFSVALSIGSTYFLWKKPWLRQ